MLLLMMAALQRADERPQGGVLAPAVRQPAARGDPRRHLVRPEQARAGQRHRADPQVRQRRQRPVQRGDSGRFAQDPRGLPALPGHQFAELSPAAQSRGQHAARAGPDDDVDVAGRARQPVLQAGQRARHPGRAEHAARPEHQADPARRRIPHGPIRTENHSSHFSSAARSRRSGPPAPTRAGQQYCWLPMNLPVPTGGNRGVAASPLDPLGDQPGRLPRRLQHRHMADAG